MRIPDEYLPKKFPENKPYVEENGLSAYYVVFTTNGQMDIALWNENKKLWYSEVDPTGFGNVVAWSPFEIPKEFRFNETLNKIWNGEEV